MIRLLIIVVCFSCVINAWAGPITITEDQPIDFGYTYQGANACDVDISGNLSGDCLGNGSNGIISVDGDPNASLVISVATLGWIGDLKVTPEIPRANKFAYVTNGLGTMSFPVFGKIQMRSSPGGIFSIQYTVTVNYQ